jgi:hypothetical protein
MAATLVLRYYDANRVMVAEIPWPSSGVINPAIFVPPVGAVYARWEVK